jgi:phosphotransferase family enzyme
MLADVRDLIGREAATSVDELVAGATSREPVTGTDGKSGATLERVVLDGERFVLKRLHVDHDWTMRGFGDLGCRPLRVWTTGLLDALPPTIDHAVVGAAAGLGRHGWGAALLLHDVGEHLVPEGDGAIPLEQHRRFLDHLADLSVAFWGWEDDLDLLAVSCRYTAFNPSWLAAEAERGWPDAVPKIAEEGWARFAERCPRVVRDAVTDLRREVDPLARALADTPQAFLHGDWKLGNLGSQPDGRTILLDWTYPGAGPPLHDLAWYLALNRARLPEPKEAAIDALRASFEERGIETATWWEAQLDLCLLGCLVQFGWEKALGDDDELTWWCERAERGVDRL